MQNKSTKILDFSGHNIYVGLDVHGASWAVNILVDEFSVVSQRGERGGEHGKLWLSWSGRCRP